MGTIERVLRDRLMTAGRPLGALAREIGLDPLTLVRFNGGGGLTMKSADRLCEFFRLKLVQDQEIHP